MYTSEELDSEPSLDDVEIDPESKLLVSKLSRGNQEQPEGRPGGSRKVGHNPHSSSPEKITI